MGRIITFKAPAYYSSSRSASPEADSSDSETMSYPSCNSPEALSRNRLSISRPSLKGKTVSFSDLPPDICEIPDWDRSPAIPSPEEIAEARDSDLDSDEEVIVAPQTRRGSGATSVESATRWARRLSI